MNIEEKELKVRSCINSTVKKNLDTFNQNSSSKNILRDELKNLIRRLYNNANYYVNCSDFDIRGIYRKIDEDKLEEVYNEVIDYSNYVKRRYNAYAENYACNNWEDYARNYYGKDFRDYKRYSIERLKQRKYDDMIGSIYLPQTISRIREDIDTLKRKVNNYMDLVKYIIINGLNTFGVKVTQNELNHLVYLVDSLIKKVIKNREDKYDPIKYEEDIQKIINFLYVIEQRRKAKKTDNK